MREIRLTSLKKPVLVLVLTAFCFLSPLFGERAPINVNLIIDGSSALSAVKGEVTSWVCDRLDKILVDGDVVTIWNAGPTARIIYSQAVNSAADRETVKKNVRDIQTANSSAADFSGALREAAATRQISAFSYTLLISASQEALSSFLAGSQSGMLRFSRVEEFPAWRALVVGQNLDRRVKEAATSFFGS